MRKIKWWVTNGQAEEGVYRAGLAVAGRGADGMALILQSNQRPERH